MLELERWVRVECHFLNAELDRFQAGAKLIERTGIDVTADKVLELKARLAHAKLLLNGAAGD